MSYSEHGVELDLSSAGRGLQQTLLLLLRICTQIRGAVLLLDEPDAHLEILRQRQIYHLLTEVADESSSQIIAASHSEVLLNEAAGRDMVIAFVGTPHRIDDRGSQVLKSLRDIGFEQYYQAEQTGWVLYLEGSTDLSILKEFARRLGHKEAIRALERPFVKFVGNDPSAIRRSLPRITRGFPRAMQGVVLFDRLDSEPRDIAPVECLMWQRREIENYFALDATLEAFATATASDAALGPLFTGQNPKYRTRCEGSRSGARLLLARALHGVWTSRPVTISGSTFCELFQETGFANLRWPRRVSTNWLSTFPSTKSIPRLPKNSMRLRVSHSWPEMNRKH